MNKKILISAVLIFAIACVLFYVRSSTNAVELPAVKTSEAEHKYPDFYKGFYLNSASGKNIEKLSGFISKAKSAGLNTVVIDVQTAAMDNSVTPQKNVEYCIENGFHPIARVVLFPDGLSDYPILIASLEKRLVVAEAACQAGFKEIQLDYIRFNDHGVLKHLTIKQKYQIIKEVVEKFKDRLEKFNVRIAVDVFGRIPLNIDDPIGQKMEVFDEVVDVICPMAYPSHYTWSKKMMNDPYYTVHLTSVKAKERAKKSIIVPWIQSFQMKVKQTGLGYEMYVEEQIKAVNDAGVSGFIFWNASQEYDIPFAASKKFDSRSKTVASKEETDTGGK